MLHPPLILIDHLIFVWAHYSRCHFFATLIFWCQVPAAVAHSEFWQRYFYKVFQLEQVQQICVLMRIQDYVLIWTHTHTQLRHSNNMMTSVTWYSPAQHFLLLRFHICFRCAIKDKDSQLKIKMVAPSADQSMYLQ